MPERTAEQIARELARSIRPLDDIDGMCRDCADNDGVCPNSGIVCDLAGLLTNALRSYANQVREECAISHSELCAALKGAMHALRSYQFGNGSTDLAASIADHAEAVLQKAEPAIRQRIHDEGKGDV